MLTGTGEFHQPWKQCIFRGWGVGSYVSTVISTALEADVRLGFWNFGAPFCHVEREPSSPQQISGVKNFKTVLLDACLLQVVLDMLQLHSNSTCMGQTRSLCNRGSCVNAWGTGTACQFSSWPCLVSSRQQLLCVFPTFCQNEKLKLLVPVIKQLG